MANILDYLKWRGDLTFEERGVNEIDALIFSTLAYTIMDGIAEKGSRTPGEILTAYEKKGYDQSSLANDPLPLLRAAAASARFSAVRVSDYVNLVRPEEKMQFSAVTFTLPGTVFAAFRGTDSTIVGWREDLGFSFCDQTPGQKEAVKYLNRAAKKTSLPLFAGGHSKGGNFAVYAALFAAKEVRDRIDTVYSFDGPGFRDSIARLPRCREIAGKVRLYLPEGSMVGILQKNIGTETILKSALPTASQHAPYAWEVMGDAFVTSPSRNAASLHLSAVLDAWLKDIGDEQRERVLTALFDALESTGAKTLSDLSDASPKELNAILRVFRKEDPAVQKLTRDALKKLFFAWKEVYFPGRKKKK